MKTYIFHNPELPGVEITVTESDAIEAALLLDTLLLSLYWIKFDTVSEWQIKTFF